MRTLPPEAEELLAAPPDEFVSRRGELARKLREEGRRDEATSVSELRKPPPVVLAVNRAARDRPEAAREAARAAERLARAQLSGDRPEYEAQASALAKALDLLEEVALAQLSRGDRRPSESTTIRVRELLKATASNDRSRALLVRGALAEEIETSGFEAFAGVPLPEGRRAARPTESRGTTTVDERPARRRELRECVRAAREALAAAEDAVRSAEREREAAARALEELEAELER